LDVEMSSGDLLVLETLEDSPLLQQPPQDFYEKLQKDSASRKSFMNRGKNSMNADDFNNMLENSNYGADVEGDLGLRRVWKDLKVIFDVDHQVPKGEFLTAFVVSSSDSPLVNKTINELGYSRLPGVVLISVERPRHDPKNPTLHIADAISLDTPIQVGDILWYSGGAEAIADMQKVQGLAFYHGDETKEAPVAVLTERRLVQAVVAKGSPLVGQTIKDVHFRSAYGGAVISIQRGSERVHELPANVKLQTGDVLLIEAGSSFVEKHGANYRTFALVSEVENSAPPRPRLFLLCAAMMIAMLGVAGADLVSLLVAAGLVGVVMVSLKIVTQQEARDALQWDIYVTVACAFGIGEAMTNSGVATGVASFLVFIGQSLNIGGKRYHVVTVLFLST
jgi:di/tricarboxylate transporter